MSTYLNISDKIKLNSGPNPLLLNFYEGAAAAYSLRKLDALYNGDAITVRRASDNNTQNIGFVNNELDTASLESFVNSGQTFDNPDITSATGWTIGAKTTYNASTEAFDLVNENGLTVRQGKSVAGHTYAITIVLNNVTSGGVKVYAGGTQSAVYSTNGTHTFNITAGSSNDILGINPNGLVNLSISSFYAVDITGDGFVTTWYDQSGNGNNAAQSNASSQPKIVSLGSTITENTKPTIKFDGVDDFLLNNDTISASSNYWVFYARNLTIGSGDYVFDTEIGRMVFERTYQSAYYDGGFIGTPISSGNHLIHLELVSPSSGSVYEDGVNTQSGLSYTQNAISSTNAIGGRYSGGLNANINMQEFIIYNTDQSSNRTAIETNINSYYSIY